MQALIMLGCIFGTGLMVGISTKDPYLGLAALCAVYVLAPYHPKA